MNEVIVVKDYDAVSKEAFEVMKEVVTGKEDAVLVLRPDPVLSDYMKI